MSRRPILAASTRQEPQPGQQFLFRSIYNGTNSADLLARRCQIPLNSV